MLLKEGSPVALPPKAFDILVVLVENAGELIDNKHMLEVVWPDSFVEEANIHVQMSSIRKALGENGKRLYIETVPKVGYRFIGAVTEHWQVPVLHEKTGFPENSLSSVARSPAFPSKLLRRLIGSILLFVLVAGTALYLISWNNREQPLSFQEVTISKVTNSGNDSIGAISPDGINLAFQRVENGRASLWVRNLTSGAEKQLTSPSEQNFDSLTFSPDGEAVYFTQTDTGDPNKKTTLFKLPLLNGDPTRLMDMVDSRVTFSPEGDRIAFIRVNRVTGESDLRVADSIGGNERIISRSFPAELIRWPAWAPNSNKIAIFKMNAEADSFGNRYSLFEVDVDSGDQVQIGQERWRTFGNIVWVRNGSGMLFTSSKRPSSPSQIWFVDRRTGASRQVTNDTSDYSDVSVDNFSSLVLAVRKDFRSSIWVSDATGTHDSLTRITNGASTEEGNKGISFTPDGRLLYTGSTDGNWDIWVMNRNGTERKRLSANEFLDLEPVAAPDNSSVIYESQAASGTTHIWKMDPDGGNKNQLTHSLFENYPAISGDGQWLLYVGGENVKEIKLWKLHLSGGQAVVLSDRPIRSKLATSPDGSLVAFLSYHDSEPSILTVIVLRIDDGQVLSTLEAPQGIVPNSDIRWSPDGGAITYRRKVGPVSNLWNLPIDGSAPREITRFETDLIYNFAWSKDGMLAMTRGGASTDLVAIKPTSSRASSH